MSLVILTSGGIDSSLMSLLAHEEGMEIHPLFVDYGQLGAEREWRACRFVHEKHHLPTPARMDLSGFGRLIPSGITRPEMRINEDAFLPGRNALLLLAGAAYACSLRADGVAIGLLSEEAHLFPDQTSAFLRECEHLVQTALGTHIAVEAPLMHMSKRAVIDLAEVRGLGGTYSCHAGTETPCGACVSCREIEATMKGD